MLQTHKLLLGIMFSVANVSFGNTATVRPLHEWSYENARIIISEQMRGETRAGARSRRIWRGAKSQGITKKALNHEAFSNRRRV
jgi:hypothetical protein